MPLNINKLSSAPEVLEIQHYFHVGIHVSMVCVDQGGKGILGDKG